MPPLSLVTGANRGIGLALTEVLASRGHVVVATVRDPASAKELNALASFTGRVDVRVADVTDAASLAALAEGLGGKPLDLLVANAGVLYGKGADLDDPAFGEAEWRETLMANVYGPFATVRALAPNLRAAKGKVAVMASRMGSTARAPGSAFSYRASKAAAVNLARNLSGALAADGVAVGAYHPGWVRTDMGGDEADIDVATSAEGLADRFEALTLETTGCFEGYDGEQIAY